MDHDTSDILGEKPRLRTDATQRSGFSFSMTQAVLAVIVIVGLIVVARRVWRWVQLWRENSFKLATRRKHGIPDSDQRPFNVAYSEAVTRARDKQRPPTRPRPSFRPQVFQPDQQQALHGQQYLRNRTAAPLRSESDRYPSIVPVPGRFNIGSYDASPQAYGGGHNSVPSDDYESTRNGLVRQGGYIDLNERDAESGLEEEEELEEEHEAQKSRVEDDEMIDGDEDAKSKNLSLKRGSKRGVYEDENDDYVRSKKFSGKRARKVSQNHDMDVDDEEADEITELKSTTRGKKRDRTEAGSTFGGDDEESEGGQEVDANAKARRRRKRRTVAKRKSEASYLRGRKRERDDGEDSNDIISEESSPEKKHHKKGKRASKGGHPDKAPKSDVSMDESVASSKSKVRNIGDEWESNGITYKIGPNGQRLRQALVKKARPKFVMPKDSLHPDRDANLQVYVETWLTEEEYQEAKAQQILAWQDSSSVKEKEPKKQLSLDISQAVPAPQVPTTGKTLLWSSTTTTPTSSPGPQSPPPETLRYRGYRHSIATPSDLLSNPFNQPRPPPSASKRIASNTRAMMLNGSPGLSDSTNGSPRIPIKVYSKWEKQEFEAQALMRIREANKQKELEKEAKLKEEKEQADRLAAEQQRLQQERLEKERAEQARIEKEKADKERAEAERKKKEEAAKAAIPNITVTAPPAQPAHAPPATNESVPNNLFSVPPAASTSSPFGFGVPKPTQTTAGQPSSTQSLFSNPAQPSSSAAQPPATGFSFNPSGASAATSTPSPFSAPPAKKEEPSTDASANTQGSSLLSRLGPQVPEPPKPQTQPTNPLFSFQKPDLSSSAGTPQNIFGHPSTAATSVPSAGGSPLKFNFAVPNKTTTSTSTPTVNSAASTATHSSATPSSLSGVPASEPPKISPKPTPATNPMFSFKTPATPAAATTNAAAAAAASTTPVSTTPVAAPKFSFAQSAFAPQPASGLSASTQNTTQNKEPVKSPFGNVPATSAFGNTNTASVFGNTNPTSAFGNTTATSPFGNTNPTPGFGTTTSASAFAPQAPSGSSSTTQNKETVKSPFGNIPATSAFGNTTPAATFGKTNTSTSAFGNNATSSSVFGKSTVFGNAVGSGPSPFGATAAQTSSVFGGGNVGNAAAAASKPAEVTPAAPKLTFNFGGNTSSTPASTNGGIFGGTAEAKSAFPSATPSTPTAATSMATPAATTPAAFSFNFGSTTPAASPFGAPAAGQSVFGKPAGGTSSTTTPVFGGTVFGAPAQSK